MAALVIYTADPGFRTARFTTIGARGREGPTSLGDHYRGQDHEKLVTLQNGIQLFTVPETGNYRIEAAGAAGGWAGQTDITSGWYNRSMVCRGALVMGNFQFQKGDVLKILVGQEGLKTKANFSAGGGGGTFVTSFDDAPYIIAGGGGGNSCIKARYETCDGTTLTSGQAGNSDEEVFAGGTDGLGATEGAI
uniref:receptor protein-tyrosine kinase n=1 Tax=Branchiostoma floridae TaxID=7739 RepID=C3ZKD1_BRAFL|eukprot:XP_002591019.1 hypothetical protein BRAFLDRAFT_69428 [Branchiostoma floridae]